MRPLLTLALLLTLAPLAHADTLDDFVLTGNGHTYAFSLPATGFASGEPTAGITSRVRYTQSTKNATIDGVDVGGASGQFVLEPGFFGTATFGIGVDDTALYDTFYGPVLVGYDPTSLSDYAYGPYQAFFLTGTFDLSTVSFNPLLRILYTLTITPQTIDPSPPSPVPEPSSLILLTTGTLGLFTTLRRRTKRNEPSQERCPVNLPGAPSSAQPYRA